MYVYKIKKPIICLKLHIYIYVYIYVCNGVLVVLVLGHLGFLKHHVTFWAFKGSLQDGSNPIPASSVGGYNIRIFKGESSGFYVPYFYLSLHKLPELIDDVVVARQTSLLELRVLLLLGRYEDLRPSRSR